MTLVRPAVFAAEVTERPVMPSDLVAGGENILAGALVTIGDGVWTGAEIATGLIRRTGPTGAYADTTDTAVNIIAALKGNAPNVDIVSGTTFRMILQNTVAFALTFAAGVGVVAGTGTLNVAASLVREYLWTILNADGPFTVPCVLAATNKVITFILPPGMVAYPIGPAVNALNITPGMTISGTGITAGTKVLGVTQGQGGVIGVTTDTNNASTQTNTALTFGPTVQIDGIRSSTL